MYYGLPKSVEICDKEYEIRTDFRVILDIFEALNDPNLSQEEKVIAALSIFYVDIPPLEQIAEAIEKCFWFINCGEEEDGKKAPKLVDWAQDFPYIISAVNRVAGSDVRGIEYDLETNTGGYHWWTFMSAYQEIGDCMFSQIVAIRAKKARGKKLEKAEQEWYRNNRSKVDFKTVYTDAENEILKQWGV